LRKLTKHDKYDFYGVNLDANQWFLSVMSEPKFWTQINLIKIGDKGGDKLKQKTRADENGLTSLVNLFQIDSSGNIAYVLENDYNTAFRKKIAEQTEYDKEVIKANDRMQVLNALLSYQYFRVAPSPNDPNHKWNAPVTEQFMPDLRT